MTTSEKLILGIEGFLAIPGHFLNKYGLMLAARATSFFALPIEGSFWASAMVGSDHAELYGKSLAFFLDLMADYLVYKFGRIHQGVGQSERKLRYSYTILGFVVFNAVASWATSAWQLARSVPKATILVPFTGVDVGFLAPLFFALIQPVMGAGASWATAIQDGKFRDPPKRSSEKKVVKTEPEAATRRPGAPGIGWWRAKYPTLENTNGPFVEEDVRALALAEWEKSPSQTTLYNWKTEANQGSWLVVSGGNGAGNE
jgi:hypothetical protein